METKAIFLLLFFFAPIVAPAQDQSSADAAIIVAEPGQQVASFRGNGNQTTNSFSLNGGIATFNVFLNWEQPDETLSNGEGQFSVILQDSTGKDVEAIVGTFDYFNGARTIQITKAGTYTLKIVAPGPWSISVDQ